MFPYGWVGKDKIGERLTDFAQNLYTIAADYLVQKFGHNNDVTDIA
jgi:hypothetical protein